MDTYKAAKLRELRTLKSFFEQCEKSPRTTDIAGSFGAGYSIFFGNAIQYNNFDIPYSAMRLIYEANKKKIDDAIEWLSKVE